MLVESLKLPGCLILKPKVVQDVRGVFVKQIVVAEYQCLDLPTTFAEEYYTRSSKNVLRGMHFQTPPYEYSKFVSCLDGYIKDVIVDLRVGSPQYKVAEVIELDARDGYVLFIPSGIAHGFLVLSESAIVSYKVTQYYFPANDTGVKWDSIPIDWGVKQPIVSARDLSFQNLSDYKSPFIFNLEENS